MQLNLLHFYLFFNLTFDIINAVIFVQMEENL